MNYKIKEDIRNKKNTVHKNGKEEATLVMMPWNDELTTSNYLGHWWTKNGEIIPKQYTEEGLANVPIYSYKSLPIPHGLKYGRSVL